MPFCVVLVGEEKEVKAFQPAIEAARKVLGPVKIYSAHKAHEAVGVLGPAAQACGKIDVALLSNHFTAPGVEPFSDALRKVLKDKYPSVPIVCWGHPSKGGKKGEHYHHALEDSSPAAVADMLARIQAGELTTGKGGGDLQPRKSMGSPSMRRKSLDDSERSGSMRRQSMELDNRMGSMTNMGGLKSMGSMTNMGALQSMGSLARVSNGNPSLMSMGSMTQQGMPGAMGMGVNSMYSNMGMMSNGSMHAGSFNNADLTTLSRTGSMMAGNLAMPQVPGMLQQTMQPLAPISTIMPMMAQSTAATGQLLPSPAPASLGTPPSATGLDINALAAGTAGLTGVSNAELIRMLAGEVVRLRKKVEEKKQRASIDLNNLTSPRTPATTNNLAFSQAGWASVPLS